LAKETSTIDTNYLDRSLVGSLTNTETIKSVDFIHQVSASRISSLFKYNNTPPNWK